MLALLLAIALVPAPPTDAQQKTLVVTGYGGRWSEVMKRVLVEPFEKKFGGRLLEGYGLTEASPVVSAHRYSGVRKLSSVGQAIPGVEIAILDFNAEGVGELRAGQQRTGVSRRGDLVDFHCNLSLFASERKRNSRKTA